MSNRDIAAEVARERRFYHSIEWGPYWRYRTTLGTEPPDGEGWELNVDAGDGGYTTGSTWADGTEHRWTHWRKYVGTD